jgi:beta-lactamase superfamily II metal-dependent hydrolase
MAKLPLTLTFHILNVGHGSSVVVEAETKTGRAFGVIDSNKQGTEPPKALRKLRELGATKLSFLCMTHPHADHFSGLYDIICAFPNAIDHFYSCPMGDLLLNQGRLKQLCEKLKKLCNCTDGLTQRQASLEFMQILRWADTGAKSGTLEWRECSGESSSIAPPGFSPVEISTILPPNRVKGTYISRIERSDMSVFGTFQDNEISLALQFLYGSVVVVLGGDGTNSNWKLRRRYETNKNAAINAQVANLPHHGSRRACTSEVLTQLFSDGGRRIAVTSADGQSHPDLEVIKWLEHNSVEPYCTNLIPTCGANAQRLLVLPGLDPLLARWIREVAANVGKIQPCQGNIAICIEDDGAFDVLPEHNNSCAFRGDYQQLMA